MKIKDLIDDPKTPVTFVDGKLYLNLNGKKRVIGKLVKDGDGLKLVKKLDEYNHTMRANDSWGMCYAIIEALDDGDTVEVLTAKRTYKATVKTIKEQGEFLWFKTQGFEKQIFLTKGLWSE